MLGIKPLKMLVLGFSLPKNLFTALESERAVALLAAHAHQGRRRPGAVPARSTTLAGDEAFIAGLLQEIGELVLVQDLGEPYVRFLDARDAAAAATCWRWRCKRWASTTPF